MTSLYKSHYEGNEKLVTGVRTVDLSDLDISDASIIQPHHHSYHLIALVTTGHAELNVSGGILSLREGDILFLPQNTLHAVRECKSMSSHNIIFSNDMINCLPVTLKQVINYNLLIKNGVRVISPDNNTFAELSDVYGLLFNEVNNSPSPRFSHESIEALFCAFMSKSIREANQETTLDAIEDDIYIEFINLLGAHSRAHLKVADYAEMLGISIKTLDRHITKVSGKSPQKLISLKTISDAKDSLQTTALSIKEIAFELGFCDSAHFINFFRNITGISPSHFRDLHKPFSEANIIQPD